MLCSKTLHMEVLSNYEKKFICQLREMNSESKREIIEGERLADVI